MRFDVGCDLKELKEYWSRSGYDGNLDYLMNVVVKDPSQLIVWRDNGKVVGHAVWHESNTVEHRKGYARDREDREALNKLLGKEKNFVELHEIWLIKEYKGKGYGDLFHDFFEKFMRERGYSDLIFYAHHPAAVAICRKCGYDEGGYLKGLREYVFHLSLKKSV
jgi:GNAT superfamily N-acetyltransferase